VEAISAALEATSGAGVPWLSVVTVEGDDVEAVPAPGSPSGTLQPAANNATTDRTRADLAMLPPFGWAFVHPRRPDVRAYPCTLPFFTRRECVKYDTEKRVA
jgi:hypothetical protein